MPSTSPSSPGAYFEVFRRAAASFDSLLCITVGRRFSGMFQSARAGADMARKSFPSLNIEVLDSGTAAGAEGWVVLAAARAAVAGSDLARVAEVARIMMPRVHLVAVVDTLRYLARGGRVPQVAAWASDMLQVKPVIRVIPMDGGVELVARVRTKSRAVDSMIRLVRDMAGKESLHALVQHGDSPQEAGQLAERIHREFNVAELYIREMTPVVGVHTGPGLLAVSFYAGQ